MIQSGEKWTATINLPPAVHMMNSPLTHRQHRYTIPATSPLCRRRGDGFTKVCNGDYNHMAIVSKAIMYFYVKHNTVVYFL